jgi:hypothetical protein
MFIALLILRMFPPKCVKRSGDVSPTGIEAVLCPESDQEESESDQELEERPEKRPRVSQSTSEVLTYGYRVKMAAMLITAHKMVTCQPGCKTISIVLSVITRFLTHEERPEWQSDIQRMLDVHASNEFWIITKVPMLRLIQYNPMTYAEERIEQLVLNRTFNRDLGIVFRGILPFFFFSAMLNPSVSVLETLAASYTILEIGYGAVGAMIACAQAGMVFRIDYYFDNDNENCVSETLLNNARSQHSGWLRSKCESYSTPSFITTKFARHAQRLLSPGVLKAAADSFN